MMGNGILIRPGLTNREFIYPVAVINLYNEKENFKVYKTVNTQEKIQQ